ncbi:hypothetical protein JCM14469_40330 [Desulfatiferula olefinivorans]
MSETQSEGHGYAHPDYARSLCNYGEVVPLARACGSLLRRPVPGASDDGRAWADFMGPYPFLCCENYALLPRDLDELGQDERHVSAVWVHDPFAAGALAEIRSELDVCRVFKDHYVIEANRYHLDRVSRHHRYYVRKSAREVYTQRVAADEHVLDEWCRLYDELIARHRLTGIHAFSREAFDSQLRLPGTRVFTASRPDGRLVGAQIWYCRGSVAYNHLAAFDRQGYACSASYALYAFAVSALIDEGVKRLDLGGGAGTESGRDGLVAFKKGWATGTIPVYLCGRILNRDAYARLCESVGKTTFFPAYRAGEY